MFLPGEQRMHESIHPFTIFEKGDRGMRGMGDISILSQGRYPLIPLIPLSPFQKWWTANRLPAGCKILLGLTRIRPITVQRDCPAISYAHLCTAIRQIASRRFFFPCIPCVPWTVHEQHESHEKKRRLTQSAKTQRVRTGAGLDFLRLCASACDFFVAFALVAAMPRSEISAF